MMVRNFLRKFKRPMTKRLIYIFLIIILAFILGCLMCRWAIPKAEQILSLNQCFIGETHSIFIPDTRTMGTIEMERVIQCESSGDNSKRGKAGEIGVAQFMPETWEWMSEKAGLKGDIYNEQDQRRLMEWAWENNLKHHWVCYKLLK